METIWEMFLNYQFGGLGARLWFPYVLTVRIPSQTLALQHSGCSYYLARLWGMCSLEWAGTSLDLRFEFSYLNDVHCPPVCSTAAAGAQWLWPYFFFLQLGEDCPTKGSMQRKALPNWSRPRRRLQSLLGPGPQRAWQDYGNLEFFTGKQVCMGWICLIRCAEHAPCIFFCGGASWFTGSSTAHW
jgi:hypothetical protein